MSKEDTAFYRGNRAILAQFSAEEIISDGAVVLLEQLFFWRNWNGNTSCYLVSAD